MDPAEEGSIDRLLAIMAALRHPETGCPWDIRQDFGTIAPYTIEEAYEVADAIDRDNLEELKQELGDLLLQVAFHARMAEELGAFDFGDVVQAIADKMIRRHPHVFGDARAGDADAQRDAWERTKEQEREQAAGEGEPSALDGVGQALPALMRAEKLGKRAARVGFDWPDAGTVADKVREELDELAACAVDDAEAVREELGDLLFSVVNLARHLRVDPEEALRRANRKFERRFRVVEQRVRASGRAWSGFTAAELDVFWEDAKHGR